MKTISAFLLTIGLGVSRLAAQVYYEAPLSLIASVTSTSNPTYGPTAASVSTTLTKITNTDILSECVSRGVITSTSGWSIVVYYDAKMNGIYTGSDPLIRLRNADGRTADPDGVISLEPYASNATGKAGYTSNKVSGSINRRTLFMLNVKYQNYNAICYGVIPFTLKITGTPSLYYGVCGAVTAKMDGYLDSYYESLVSVTLKTGAFIRR